MSIAAFPSANPSDMLELARRIVSRPDDYEGAELRGAVIYLLGHGDHLDHSRASALQDRFEIEDMLTMSEPESLWQIARKVPFSEWLGVAVMAVMVPAALIFSEMLWA